jgi:GTP cyclohydrolase II
LIDGRATARAIDALRRGWPVVVDDVLSVLAIETADAARLADFDGAMPATILIAASRAFTLKLANQLEAATPGSPVAVMRESWLGLNEAIALADPARDLANPLQGPYRATHCDHPAAATAALVLARHAGLLPALFMKSARIADAEPVNSAAIAGWEEPAGFAIATRARLPIAACENAEIVAFRNRESAGEHIALIIGSPNGSPPLVRLHSECLTGDVLGSLKCDCGPQLEAALVAMEAAGWGILLYLRQEGRGIGLINKLRAYALQDQGFDTVDANTRLGFPVDARGFGLAARMLTLLGQNRVRLLTNNPAKVTGLEAAGIVVAGRVAHQLPSNRHNEGYLATKRIKTGHILK